MIASTWLDLVVGLDIHFEMVPMPAPVPTPFPHPFVGMVFDPAGLAMGLAISNTIGMISGGSFKGPVLIWGMPATTTGTEAKNSFVLPHFIIPPGTMWTPMPKAPKPPFKGKTRPPDLPVAPAGDAVMITGSKTVTTMGSNQCRLGDLAMSCAEPVRLPSSTVIAIPKGPLVLVGGPPAVDWLAAAMAFIKTKTIANELHGLVGRIKSPRLRGFCHWVVCTLTGHPVDVATGRMMTRATDWELPGPIPLAFERHYSSAWSNRDSPLGWGWSHSLDQSVWIERGCVVYRAGDGREIEFDTFKFADHAMRPGDAVWDPFNRLTLRNTAPFTWEVETPEGLTHHFAPVKGGDAKVARLTRIADRADNEVLLTYDPRGALDYARDSAGRIVRFEHDAEGRLVRVSLPHPSVESWVTHTRFEYSPEGELVAVTDPLGHAARFEYAGEHLMVRETDRCGLSFYFGYDGAGTDARCVRTWGDDGVYDHVLFYDAKARKTAVTDSLGNTTLYEFNEINLLVKRTDPLGGVWCYEHDASGRKTAEIDPLGGATRWEHDVYGNRVGLEQPDGGAWRIAWNDAHMPSEMETPGGARWRWQYDALGYLVALTDPGGGTERFTWRRGLLSSHRDLWGAESTLARNGDGTVSSVRLGDGSETTLTWDRRGNLIARVDPGGGVTRHRYDARDCLIETTSASGETTRFELDAEGELRGLSSSTRALVISRGRGRHVSAQREGDVTVRFEHDTEGRLTAVVNGLGERHEFTYDACGNVARERRFDGAVRAHTRDALGRLTRLEHPSGRWTTWTYDPVGRVTVEAHSDGTARRFEYDAEGRLSRALAGEHAVTFERDVTGRVLVERAADVEVRSTYDVAGRALMQSSWGARAVVRRDTLGLPATYVIHGERGDERALITWERDPGGAERARRGPGAASQGWERDLMGRPVHAWEAAGDVELAARSIQWRGDDQVAAIHDAHHGPRWFDHDERGRLIRERGGGGVTRERAHDDAGNPYRGRDLGDRVYAQGGRVVQADGQRYRYDADGLLVERVEASGDAWRFEWSGGGVLREVRRPDGSRVRYEHDALGRRVGKTVFAPGKSDDTVLHAARWVWDGDTLLHERDDAGAVLTWHWSPETQTLLARERAGRCQAVLTDHVGAPLAVLDADGALRASLRLDVWGEAEVEGDGALCPWRWPGQHVDDHTGLSYNRFRDYDPHLGLYLSPDPLGLDATLEPYTYVRDPLTLIDPLGLTPNTPPTLPPSTIHTTSDNFRIVHNYGNMALEHANPIHFHVERGSTTVAKIRADGSVIEGTLPRSVREALENRSLINTLRRIEDKVTRLIRFNNIRPGSQPFEPGGRGAPGCRK